MNALQKASVTLWALVMFVACCELALGAAGLHFR